MKIMVSSLLCNCKWIMFWYKSFWNWFWWMLQENVIAHITCKGSFFLNPLSLHLSAPAFLVTNWFYATPNHKTLQFVLPPCYDIHRAAAFYKQARVYTSNLLLCETTPVTCLRQRPSYPLLNLRPWQFYDNSWDVANWVFKSFDI